jgi:hypothetical protein
VFLFDGLESDVWAESLRAKVEPEFGCWFEIEDVVASDFSEVSEVFGMLVTLFADCFVSEDCVSELPSGARGSSSGGIFSTVAVAALSVFSPIEVSLGGRAGEASLPADVIFASLALVVTFNCRFLKQKFNEIVNLKIC